MPLHCNTEVYKLRYYKGFQIWDATSLAIMANKVKTEFSDGLALKPPDNRRIDCSAKKLN